MSKARMEALSDGVIAIVMTILILEFKVPEIDASGGDMALVHDFVRSLPLVLSYIISFLVLIVWWMSHHQLLHGVRSVDRRTILLNGAFLMCIAFVPYPTALIGRYPGLVFPSVLYGIVGLFCGLSYYGLYHHVLRNNEGHPFSANRNALAFRNTWLHLTVYAVAIGAAFVSPYGSIAVYAAIPIYFFLKKNG
ncbi:TMEM175 family protein [Cohnella zeiphila]|uniref:DUF1211 domain-containing protein n=1 Tax=Cohnella zeiphila TaxID=2761120 RepID=A0A7X0VY36_9BACL|nr:TMEM175 family protein [Cohnella zeiphila]MBB6734601.1 DUF1211 domain-containing protein [Cohnella zeiphila]